MYDASLYSYCMYICQEAEHPHWFSGHPLVRPMTILVLLYEFVRRVRHVRHLRLELIDAPY